MTSIINKKNTVFWIMALAVIVRIIGITKSFQGDEFFCVMDARSLGAIPDALLSDTHPPLFFYLLHFWMKISTAEAFLRFLSIIPGAALVLLVYLIARKIFDESVGIGSMILAAFAPVAVWSSQYVRTYSMAAFFTVLSVYFLARILKGKIANNADWAGYILSSAASIYTFYFSALIIIAENVYMAIYIRKKEFWMKWLFSQAAILALYIPWMPYFIFQRSSYLGLPQMVDKVGFYFGNIHVGGLLRSASGLLGFDPRLFAKRSMSEYGLMKAGAILASVLLAILAALGRIKFLKLADLGAGEKKQLSFFLILAVVPFLEALIIHQAFGIIVMSHYFIASFAFFAIFLVAFSVKFMSKKTQKIVLALILVLYSFRLIGMYSDKEMDFISAHKYVKAAMAKEAMVVSPSFGGMFDHYFYDIPNRHCMEDYRAWPCLAKDLMVITYPTKLEVKEAEKRFVSYLLSRGYVVNGSEVFSDLIVERYTRK